MGMGGIKAGKHEHMFPSLSDVFTVHLSERIVKAVSHLAGPFSQTGMASESHGTFLYLVRPAVPMKQS